MTPDQPRPSFVVTYVAAGRYSTSYNGPLGTSRGLFPSLADAIAAGRQWAGVVPDASP